MDDALEPFLKALQACLPGSVRVGSGLRLAEPGGGIRVIEARSPWDPQVDHGLILPWLPALEDTVGLGACHFRGRWLRSIDAIEAARAYAAGQDVEANANLMAAEASEIVAKAWEPFLNPVVFTMPGTNLIRASANVAPGEIDALIGLLKAACYLKLGDRKEGRLHLADARRTADPRLRRVLEQLRPQLADA